MRHDKINALYYPDMDVDQTTLKKAILLFDEIHLCFSEIKNIYPLILNKQPPHYYQQSALLVYAINAHSDAPAKRRLTSGSL